MLTTRKDFSCQQVSSRHIMRGKALLHFVSPSLQMSGTEQYLLCQAVVS